MQIRIIAYSIDFPEDHLKIGPEYQIMPNFNEQPKIWLSLCNSFLIYKHTYLL